MVLETGIRTLVYTVAENLAKLCSMVGWEVEPVSDEFGYLAEQIYKVLKMPPDFSWLFMVKCKRKKIKKN